MVFAVHRSPPLTPLDHSRTRRMSHGQTLLRMDSTAWFPGDSRHLPCRCMHSLWIRSFVTPTTTIIGSELGTAKFIRIFAFYFMPLIVLRRHADASRREDDAAGLQEDALRTVFKELGAQDEDLGCRCGKNTWSISTIFSLKQKKSIS